MRVKVYKICFLIFIQTSIVLGCTVGVQTHADEFYNDVGTWDSMNLPLIKPYYLIYISKDYGWQMPLDGNVPESQYHYAIGDLLDIRKVAVVNSIIMVYTPDTPNVDESLGQKVLHWFVIVPNKENLEIGFENEADFLEYIKTLGIDSPQWVEPDVAYKEYFRTGCFDWIPDCK
jgi:hypothetical protein